MRKVLSLAVLFGAVALARSQPVDEEDLRLAPRYEVPGNPRIFSQRTPKDALASVLKTVERGRFDYLVAHLMDPAYVDARVRDRGVQFERAVEIDLVKLREKQRENPGSVPKERVIPDEPDAFRRAVILEAQYRAYQQLVRDVRDKLAEDAQSVKELGRFLTQGNFDVQDTTAKATLADLKDRQLFFRRDGLRWFVENRQAEEAVPEKKGN